MSRLRAAAATDTGYLRVTNQDLALASSHLAVVADGMGGHLGGEVAARVAVEEVLEAYRRDQSTDGLIAAVRAANEAVFRRGRSDRNLRGMGTTLTAAGLVDDEPDGQLRIALVNVGDSRAYLMDRRGGRIHQLTEDHSVVEEMVRSGELTPDEAAVHPHRHILTRALGIDATIDPDCWEIDLEPTSRLLLCSDGLTNELAEQEIAEVLAQESDTNRAAAELVRRALARGGTDNVTVVVVDVLAGQAPTALEDVVMVPEGAAATTGLRSAGGTSEVTEAIAAMPIGSVVATGQDLAEGAAPGAAVSSTAAPGTNPLGTPAIAPGTSGAHPRPILLVRSKRPKGHRDRIVTVRVVLFVLVFVAVLGGTAGVVVWFNKASFFVGLDHGHVTIFQGRPGGLLWFKPSVVERTSLTPADLLASNVVSLNQGMETSSYQAARNLVHGLSLERAKLGVTTTTTSTTTVRKHDATARGPTTTTASKR